MAARGDGPLTAPASFDPPAGGELAALRAYHQHVEATLSDLLRLVARVAGGDYSEKPPLVERDDTVSQFVVAMRFMLEDLEKARADEADRRRELHDALRRLRFQTTLLQAQGEAAIDGVLVVDQDGRMVSFNRRFVEMWRIPPAVVASRSDEAALASVIGSLQDPDGFLARVRELYAHPADSSRDEILLKDGRVFDRYSAPVRSEDGTLHGRVWYFRDISDQKRAEAELRAANESLKALGALKTRFLNMAAHELATPLTPIKLQTHMLRAQTAPVDDARRKKAAEVLDRNVDRLAALVRDILDASRVDGGHLQLRWDPVSVDTMVAETVESFEPAARAAGVALEARAAPGLWVQGDGRRLGQVLYNLVSNALKHTPRGGTVTVMSAGGDGCVRVAVKDTGPGLTGDQIERLFQPFSQVHDSPERAGTGLGLFICKGIVEQHGGTIRCESPGAGSGATFAFDVPMVPPVTPPRTRASVHT